MKIEDLLLPEEEIKEISRTVPTPDEWKRKPSHDYWEKWRLLKAQVDHILTLIPALKTAIETGAELAVLDKDQSLPELPYMDTLEFGKDAVNNFKWGADVAQREMRDNAHFRKVSKR